MLLLESSSSYEAFTVANHARQTLTKHCRHIVFTARRRHVSAFPPLLKSSEFRNSHRALETKERTRNPRPRKREQRRRAAETTCIEITNAFRVSANAKWIMLARRVIPSQIISALNEIKLEKKEKGRNETKRRRNIERREEGEKMEEVGVKWSVLFFVVLNYIMTCPSRNL